METNATHSRVVVSLRVIEYAVSGELCIIAIQDLLTDCESRLSLKRRHDDHVTFEEPNHLEALASMTRESVT
jgi:hypothetical protein